QRGADEALVRDGTQRPRPRHVPDDPPLAPRRREQAATARVERADRGLTERRDRGGGSRFLEVPEPDAGGGDGEADARAVRRAGRVQRARDRALEPRFHAARGDVPGEPEPRGVAGDRRAVVRRQRAGPDLIVVREEREALAVLE